MPREKPPGRAKKIRLFNFLLGKRHFIGSHHHHRIPGVTFETAIILKECMNTIERSTASHAKDGQTVIERGKDIRIGSFVFDIIGRIINRGCSNTEFKPMKRLIICDDFIIAVIEYIQIFLKCFCGIHLCGRSIRGNNDCKFICVSFRFPH